ncbi:hypothetical protein A1A1_10471 [Planococcus antarcticus DSM 14505]|uniref:ABC transporter permease n=1 Tax=Planococcus antarcticus DSM 14505 TaxID=1185653 RepID=A0A1C7DBU0_9BACL|nr:hypothetical protein [Planococcus antarcticus]ANU08956.1 hypothetical protein BBH88_00700 [Planococcus antarcticus DSM 14505]EIM06568.1 hypothetical protein A1A1_10471 [Planococcus antarcticus DSM 14505]
MNQLRGLFMKDWTIIKGYVLLALLLDIIIPVGSATLFQAEFYEGLLVFSGTVMALHTLVPIVLLSILFTKEMDRPDIFFHSSASIHKINASKLLTVLFATAISLIWISALTFITLLFAPDLAETKNLLPTGTMFAAGILFFSIQITFIYYFYLTIFYTMKSKIGGFSYIVTFGLFMFSLEMWDRFKTTELYATVTNFWIIPIKESDLLTNVSRGLMGAFETPGRLPIGEFLISSLLLVFLYFLSSYLFEKKVRA